jgi:hypothetical protein
MAAPRKCEFPKTGNAIGRRIFPRFNVDDLVKNRLSRASGKPGSANILKRLDSHFHGNDGKIDLRTFYETINVDDLVKSHRNDGFVKSSRCKARKN